MIGTRRLYALAGLIVLALLAVACSDDDDPAAAPSSASENDAGDAGSSSVTVELVDFGFQVSGALGTGVQTIETTNSGDEIHMMGIARLNDGVDADDVVAALSGTAEGEEGEDRSGDPVGDLIAQELGTPGHILLPGTTQRITLDDDLDVGRYVLLCFIPAEGDGLPHFQKGMVGSLDVVVEGGDTTSPEADAAYTLPDDAPAVGPTQLPAGEVVLKLTNDGDIGKDVTVAATDDGEDFGAFDRFFEELYEGTEPPPVGAAVQVPGTIAGSTFNIPPGQTIHLTVVLTAGKWSLVNTANAETAEGQESQDHLLALEVT